MYNNQFVTSWQSESKNTLLNYQKMGLKPGETLAPRACFMEVGPKETIFWPSISVGKGVSTPGKPVSLPHLMFANIFLKSDYREWKLFSGEERSPQELNFDKKQIAGILDLIVKHGAHYLIKNSVLAGEWTEDTRHLSIRIQDIGQSGYRVGIDPGPLSGEMETLVPLLKWEITELIKNGKVFFSCPNCGNYFTRRYRQRSAHCHDCTNISKLSKCLLSPEEHAARKAKRNQSMEKYRRGLREDKEKLKQAALDALRTSISVRR